MIKNNFKISKLKSLPVLDGKALDSDFFNLATQSDGNQAFDITYKIEDFELKIGQKIKIEFGGFRCVECDKSVKKLFSGFCYPCLQSKACADLCITSPQRCHFMAGTCREPEWALDYCYQPHYLYLSFTDKFKVGLTRLNQIPTRWIDQGATAATIVAKVTSRHQAGVLENAITQFVGDKTHWQRMLKSQNTAPNFEEFLSLRKTVLDFLSDSAANYKTQSPPERPAESSQFFTNPKFFALTYPIASLPDKIASLSLEKSPTVEGVLKGIKGQYLIFENGVFNFRRHEGSIVTLSIGEN